MSAEKHADSLRWARILTWAAPPALLLAVFYEGLTVWFFQDDFSHLLLAMLPENEFWPSLLQPRAQGTFRPLSERLYFYFGYHWFGLNTIPWRVVVFATQILNLWLLGAVTRRLTGSAWAGLAAASIWAIHHGSATSLSWVAAYNQILCSFFFLLGFWLFLRFADTGRWGYYWAQWVTFLLAFASLETAVVYPALLLVYALLMERRLWRLPLPMLLAAGGLALLQLQAAPPTDESVYQLRVDLGLFDTLWFYIRWAVAGLWQDWVGVLYALPLVVWAIYRSRRGEPFGLFCLAWFLITLAPYLPLGEHRSQYYLVIPALGLAMLMGRALVWVHVASPAGFVAALAALAVFAYGSIGVSQAIVRHNARLAEGAKSLAEGVVQARKLYPNKTLLLAKVPQDFFYASIFHDMFRVVQIYDVYVSPAESEVKLLPGFDSIDRFFLTPEEARSGLRRGTIEVLDAEGPRLKVVTRRYRALAPMLFEKP